MQFAVVIILVVLPSSLVHTFCILLYLSWGSFVTCNALKIVHIFLYNSLLLQSISKHTNVAYIWWDTASVYIWYISLVCCCIFCTLHPSTPHLFDCCIIMIGVQCQSKVSSDIIWWCMSNGSIVYWCGRRMLYNNNRMVIRGWNGVAAAMAWSLQ